MEREISLYTFCFCLGVTVGCRCMGIYMSVVIALGMDFCMYLVGILILDCLVFFVLWGGKHKSSDAKR